MTSFARTLLLIVITSSLSALAAESSYLNLKNQMNQGDISQPKGFWPLLGAGMGAMGASDNVRTGGVPMHMKLIGSYYFTDAPWVADVGLGLHNQFLTQTGGGSDSIQSLYTELAARYQFTNKWQLGAIWNTLVDNPDRYRSNTNNLASFIGVQALKDFTWDQRYLVRAGGRMTTDVGISGDTVNTIMAEIQVSFGGGQTVAMVPPQEEPIVSEPIAPHLSRAAFAEVEITSSPLHFESQSTQLVSSSRIYMKRLARALADNRHLFDRIELVGHADQRGTQPYNKKLSENRAKTIGGELVSAGLSKDQVRTNGRGSMQLLSQQNTASAWAKNRRVEFRFVGVKNPTALKNVIDSVIR